MLQELLLFLPPIAFEIPTHWGAVSFALKKQGQSSALSLASDYQTLFLVVQEAVV